MKVPNKFFFSCIGLFKMCTPWLDLSDKVSSTPNRDHMQNLRPRKVDISTTPIGAHKPFGVSSFEVRVLDVYGFIIYALC
jgi:hypothetical protein